MHFGKVSRMTLLSLLVFAEACSGAKPKSSNQSNGTKPTILEPVHVVAKRDGERLDMDAYDASELFDRAARALRKGKCEEAIEYYEKLMDEFAESNLLEPSLYNEGLCYDQLEMYRQAATKYKALIEKYPDSNNTKDALFRLAGSYENLEAWDEAIDTFDLLLYERNDLKGVERIEALTRKGSAQMMLGQPDDAKLVLEEAVRLQRSGRSISPSDSIFHYSMAQFKLGEIVHNEMRAIKLPANESLLEQTLEKKAQLLLDAQRLYTKVIRIGHPHWASAAAYRIGSLYHHLWVDILAAPAPEDLTEEEQEIYTDILKKRIKVLLTKAVVQWERTMKLAIRLGLDNEWVDSTTADLEEIRNVLKIEEEHEQMSKEADHID